MIVQRAPASGLGSMWSFSGDCTIARARIVAMRALFDGLAAANRIDASRWGPVVESIEAAGREADPWIEAFSCHGMRDVGEQAIVVSERMALAAGVAAPPVPGSSAPRSGLGTVLPFLAGAALVGWLGYKVMKAR